MASRWPVTNQPIGGGWERVVAVFPEPCARLRERGARFSFATDVGYVLAVRFCRGGRSFETPLVKIAIELQNGYEIREAKSAFDRNRERIKAPCEEIFVQRSGRGPCAWNEWPRMKEKPIGGLRAGYGHGRMVSG